METPISRTAQLSDETVVNLIRDVRNDLIKDFLDERYLKDYILSKYAIKEISPVKVEFIKRDLKEFLISPVNKTHYKDLVEQIQTQESAALSEDTNSDLFYKEVDLILRRYIF